MCPCAASRSAAARRGQPAPGLEASCGSRRSPAAAGATGSRGSRDGPCRPPGKSGAAGRTVFLTTLPLRLDCGYVRLAATLEHCRQKLGPDGSRHDFGYIKPQKESPNPNTGIRPNPKTSVSAKWGEQLPIIGRMWRESWQQIIPFLAYQPEVRRVIYATDESVKRSFSCGWCGRGVRLRSGRGRPPSEAQVLGLMPAAQLAPQRAFSVASRWRRPRPDCRGRGLASPRPVVVSVLGLLGEFEFAPADFFERVAGGVPFFPRRAGTPARSSSARSFFSVSDCRANASSSPRSIMVQHRDASLRAVATIAIWIPRRERTR